MRIYNRIEMKNKYILSALLLLGTATIGAQETYENTKLIDNDLNGTARYVGMGGALDALGADISVIGSNPAGLGLMTKSRAEVSFGFVSQPGVSAFQQGNPTNASFDQVGFVYVMRNPRGDNSGLNFAVNYHKSRNFDYILSAVGDLKNASQNTLSFLKAIYGRRAEDGTSNFYLETTKNGMIRGTHPFTSQLDNLYYNNLMVDHNNAVSYSTATGYDMQRAHTGYIGTYDVSVSGAISPRFYLGGTIGFHDVHYTGTGEYVEDLVDISNKPLTALMVHDEKTITGLGGDFKLGAIFLPIENSPFRIGLSVASPTLYRLTINTRAYIRHNLRASQSMQHGYSGGTTNESYSFKIDTPWNFGISLGHTVGNYLALGASYNYADYGSMNTRVNEGGGYDWYTDSYYENSSDDTNMNEHTKQTLKGVSTIKLGAEFRPVTNLALRAGYNYISPMYQTNAYKDGTIDSYGSNYSTATDYVNWDSTNRFTLGVGYQMKNFNIDLAYQYSEQNGDFHPFMDTYGDYYYINTATKSLQMDKIDNYANPVKVSNKRHQLLLTLGYRF
ncbi:hemin receptor [Hoylesella timonensis 4401737 = DSM 22865 = JCM 15640]|uniref:OmpP1/FadL family transporter n=2 Tax=Hoylesella timonensis TaxID=386414 RepID=UPI0004232AC2|nr:hemin receptor [Hoylesella timonensis]